MKPERILLIVVTFVLMVFVFKHCSQPGEEREAEKEKQFKTAIAVLESEKLDIQSKQDSLTKRYIDKVKEDSINLRAQNARIQALQTKLTNQRPKVIERIQADTAVLSYVNTLEEVVEELRIQNDTLKSQVQFQRKLNSDLILNEAVEDKIEQQIQNEFVRRIAEIEKSSRKEKRRGKLARVLVPLVGIGAFLFGASL